MDSRQLRALLRQRQGSAEARVAARPDNRALRSLAWAVTAALAALLLLTWLSGGQAWAADQKITVWVNGCPQEYKPGAFSRSGTTYVPLRQGVESVGGRMKWDAATHKAIITSGSKTAVVYKSQGLVVGGNLFIPLRLVGESLDCKVEWIADDQAVKISTRKTVPVPT